MKFSMPEAAELPAMTTEPKELMADWIITFEAEKRTPCSPAEKPSRSIWPVRSGYSRIFRSSRRHGPRKVHRRTVTSTAESS